MEQCCFGVGVVLIEPRAFATAIWRKFTPPEDVDLNGLEPHVARPLTKRAHAQAGGLLARHASSSSRKRAIPRHASAIRKLGTIRA